MNLELLIPQSFWAGHDAQERLPRPTSCLPGPAGGLTYSNDTPCTPQPTLVPHSRLWGSVCAHRLQGLLLRGRSRDEVTEGLGLSSEPFMQGFRAPRAGSTGTLVGGSTELGRLCSARLGWGPPAQF